MVTNLLKNVAEKLTYEGDCADTYSQMLSIFESAGLYKEQAGLLEKIYNITKESALYKQIGV